MVRSYELTKTISKIGEFGTSSISLQHIDQENAFNKLGRLEKVTTLSIRFLTERIHSGVVKDRAA